MKKSFVFFVVSLICCFCSFGETVILDWQNAEMGTDDNPKWLQKYMAKKDESVIRKQFEVEKDGLIFVGISENVDLQMATEEASVKAIKEATKKIKDELKITDENATVRIGGFDKIFSFWQEIAEVNDKKTLAKLKAALEEEDDDIFENDDPNAVKKQNDFPDVDTKIRAICIYSISKELWDKNKSNLK